MSNITAKTVEIHLNDFESFDRFLFPNGIEYWGNYYIFETNEFIPPIPFPIEEAEFQLDHYALWMVIMHFGLWAKPYFLKATDGLLIPRNRCYACQWRAEHQPKSEPANCLTQCPLTSITPKSCAELWDTWVQSRNPLADNSNVDVKAVAEGIAKIPWREM